MPKKVMMRVLVFQNKNNHPHQICFSFRKVGGRNVLLENA